MDARGVDCPTCKATAGSSCIDHVSGGYTQSWYHGERVHAADAATQRTIAAGTGLERDAAIALLIEAPAECSTERPGWASPNTRCGSCWPCRVDKFLRDAGAR